MYFFFIFFSLLTFSGCKMQSLKNPDQYIYIYIFTGIYITIYILLYIYLYIYWNSCLHRAFMEEVENLPRRFLQWNMKTASFLSLHIFVIFIILSVSLTGTSSAAPSSLSSFPCVYLGGYRKGNAHWSLGYVPTRWWLWKCIQIRGYYKWVSRLGVLTNISNQNLFAGHRNRIT